MALIAENYVPPRVASDLKKRAWTAWGAGLAAVLFWNLLILLAPIAAANDLEKIAAPLYTFFGYLCHQTGERSFYLENHQFAVCARCFGIYFGLLFGFVIYPIFRLLENTASPPRVWLFLSLVPLGVDWSLGAFGIWENTHLSRCVTGTILGAACAVFIIPALVEIFQSRLRRNAESIFSS